MKKLLVLTLISIVFAVCGCENDYSDKVFDRDLGASGIQPFVTERTA